MAPRRHPRLPASTPHPLTGTFGRTCWAGRKPLGSSLYNKISMKTKNILTVLLVAFILASCAPVAGVVPTKTTVLRADNFAFVFQDYACSSIPVNVLDTTNGTLAHTPLGNTISITISLRLTNDELESVYQKAISISFFDYPSKFVIPDYQVLGHQSRVSSYQLSMTNGAITNSVSWTDDTISRPSYTKADQLRELMYLINKIIQSHPEIQLLPEPKALCI